jgi:predicted nucleic acid-binding protein
MLVLDTDHASELAFRSAAGVRLLERLISENVDAVITAVTAEEQLRGWLAEIRRRADPEDQVVIYGRLIRQVEIIASWFVLPWDRDAVSVFKRLKTTED